MSCKTVVDVMQELLVFVDQIFRGMNEDFVDHNQQQSVIKMYNEMLITALHSNNQLLMDA